LGDTKPDNPAFDPNPTAGHKSSRICGRVASLEVRRNVVIILVGALLASSCSTSLSQDELDACFEAASYDTVSEDYGFLNLTMSQQITDAIPDDLDEAAHDGAWKAAVNDLYGITYTKLTEIFGQADALVAGGLGASPQSGEPGFGEYWAFRDKTVLNQWNESDPSSLAKFCDIAGQSSR